VWKRWEKSGVKRVGYGRDGIKIEQYVNYPVNKFNKSSYENMKENIKVLLKKT
jgi:hypothetical protein